MKLQSVHPSMQQHLPISQLSSFATGFRRLVIFMQNHQDQTASALIPGVEPGECDPYRQSLRRCRGGFHYICTETFLTCIFPAHQWCNKGRNPAPIFALLVLAHILWAKILLETPDPYYTVIWCGICWGNTAHSGICSVKSLHPIFIYVLDWIWSTYESPEIISKKLL